MLQKKTQDNIIQHTPPPTASPPSQIPDPPYRMLIMGVSGSGKTNSLLNLINHEPDIDKI